MDYIYGQRNKGDILSQLHHQKKKFPKMTNKKLDKYFDVLKTIPKNIIKYRYQAYKDTTDDNEKKMLRYRFNKDYKIIATSNDFANFVPYLCKYKSSYKILHREASDDKFALCVSVDSSK